MTLRCIVVDDEPLARERVEAYVAAAGLELVGSFADALSALAFLRTNPVDLAFVDLRLEGPLSGLELVEAATFGGQVILTTAYPEHAARAYELGVADYLVKPFTFPRFVQAVERARAAVAAAARHGAPPRSLFVRTGDRLERVVVAEVLYVEGQDDYRLIRTTGRELLVSLTFAELERRIPPEILCRVHRSWMVAIEHIDRVERDVVRIAGASIPVSDTYRERFHALLGRR